MDSVMQPEYKLDRSAWRALAVASSAELWLPVERHLEYMIVQLHSQLEFCPASDMVSLQGEIKALRQVLGLRAKALRELEHLK